jgi:glyoxylase-like metal-dependent hydrolase (beta-lactamase superfamily II)
LEVAGVRSEEIDMISLTHWHLDHVMNIKVFPGSEIVLSQSAVETHSFDYRGVNDGEQLAEGVKVLYTSGHTRDHASLLLETDHLRYSMRTEKGGRIMGIGKVRVAVAGDAILSPGYYLTGSLWTYNGDFYSEEAARESRQKLHEQADFIIPGHGVIFQNIKKPASTLSPR